MGLPQTLKAPTLQPQPSSRGNNFDLLRLLLALLVVRVHAYIVGLQITGIGDQYFLGGRSCVECFFVISGYLIFKSWDSDPHLPKYFGKRARRILPAYVFVIVGCALVLSLVSTLSMSRYFTSIEFYKYIFCNLAFLGTLQETLPGVFVGQPEPSVDGPLWTIKLEVMFYVCVPLIAWLAAKLNRVALFVAIYCCAVAWQYAFTRALASTGRHFYDTMLHQLPGQMSFFIAGAALHYYHSMFKRHAHPTFVLACLALLIHYRFGLFFLYPAALAVVVLYAATCFPLLGNFGRFGDLAYGIYIYHFPILHLLAMVPSPTFTPAMRFASGVGLTIIAALLSWRFLERRWLLRSSHYVQATQSTNTSIAEAPVVEWSKRSR